MEKFTTGFKIGGLVVHICKYDETAVVYVERGRVVVVSEVPRQLLYRELHRLVGTAARRLRLWFGK